MADLYPELTETKPKRPGLSLLSKGLANADEFLSQNKLGALLSSGLGVPDASKLLEKLAYGDRLTTGSGQTLKPAESVVEGGMALAPVLGSGLTGLGKLAKKIPLQRDSSPNALVWHGSPHKFDKFDSSKIGTGEGAQAYGHGLYLADSPAVAGSYTKAEQPVLLDGSFLNEMDPSHIAAAGLHMHRGNAAAAISDLQSSLATPHLFPDSMVPIYTEAIKLLSSKAAVPPVKGTQGNLYKVDLPDDQIAKMLDWDKPLSAQPGNVQSGLARSDSVRAYMADAESQRLRLNAGYPDRLAKIPSAAKPYDATRMTGKDAYTALSREYGNQRLVAERLKELGVPGLRYLDGSSRNLGEGTSNFVIHPGNESFLQILERNGIPLNSGLAHGR